MTNFSTKPHWFSVANDNLAVNVYLFRTKIWTAHFLLKKKKKVSKQWEREWKTEPKSDQKSEDDPLHLILKRSTNLAYQEIFFSVISYHPCTKIPYTEGVFNKQRKSWQEPMAESWARKIQIKEISKGMWLTFAKILRHMLNSSSLHAPNQYRLQKKYIQT